MARAVVLLFLIVAVATIGANPQGTRCGENEVFTSCGTSCQGTCGNPNPRACTLACVIGCACKEGYVKNAQNRCVLTQEC